MSAISLSVLIPVYNYDCQTLLERLVAERSTLPFEVEVLLGNDSSSEEFTSKYKQWEKEGYCTLVSSDTNLGAGRMRNLLASKAQGDQLLFIDSDTIPESPHFLSYYYESCSASRVVCGGFVYSHQPPTPERMLRYLYGLQVEERSLQARINDPYRSFISMCFMIPREVFAQEGFDDRLGMGYEDALFGYRLRQRGVDIWHIDNPVEHQLKENSLEFLHTTERYIENLYAHRELFEDSIRLLNLYRTLEKWHLAGALSRMAPRLLPHLARQLTSSKPRLHLFSLYKILFILSLREPKK